MDREMMSANLRKWAQITELCLELRVGWLKRDHPGLTDSELRQLVFGEFRRAKEQAWEPA